MLTNLYVKNLALIDEINIDLEEGLTVLTGETGAGKSIILGAISIALGMKVSGDIVRDESKEAVAQLSFYFDDKKMSEIFKQYDIDIPDEGELIIRRTFSGGRSRFKINGCDISAAQVKGLAPFLLDLHAQRDNLRLLKESEQLDLVDSIAGDDLRSLLEEMNDKLSGYKLIKEKLEALGDDEAARLRELDLLRFEAEEIEEAGLKHGEDEELETKFSKGENAGKIKEAAFTAVEAISGDGSGISSLLSAAIKAVNDITELSSDNDIENIKDMLYDADSIISDCLGELNRYADGIDADEEEFALVTERLNIYNKLKDKYRTDTDGILALLEEKQKRISELENAKELVLQYTQQCKELEEEMTRICEKLTAKREAAAEVLSEKLVNAAKDLNFNDLRFKAQIISTGEFTSLGDNKVCFLISTNPGEELKPLKDVASGGELSRIMLAFKTITADTDGTQTLIFDEIDTGISGRTAQMVAAKMANVAKSKQIICITHLPQIAAMGDHHFLILKSVADDRSITDIKALEDTDRITELSRLLGGDKITETVEKSAAEMIELAKKYKNV